MEPIPYSDRLYTSIAVLKSQAFYPKSWEASLTVWLLSLDTINEMTVPLHDTYFEREWLYLLWDWVHLHTTSSPAQLQSRYRNSLYYIQTQCPTQIRIGIFKWMKDCVNLATHLS